MERACDPARPLVALIGRVVPIKDIKTFIRAAALVLADMPEVRFAILGPLDEDPDYAADCEALVAELGIGNAVQFAGRVDVAQWLRSEEHTSELQSLMSIPYAVFCLKK